MKATTALLSISRSMADLETNDAQGRRLNVKAWRANGSTEDVLAQASERLVDWLAVDSAERVQWKATLPGNWVAHLDEA
ncbi:hypothetical protein [Saccharopolyspora sp. 6V]|uniref:hypothetical protein n=1 Tax=Saccharopolyspora sp. 6V TaxID=2877239 RepID=UPI001CD4583D|nr:hypothetical protein [Saccharopolyspora sp. 6V]MCA1191671.1 hypothetical protein [Saccharopolyspora sp. 6V]